MRLKEITIICEDYSNFYLFSINMAELHKAYSS